MNEHIASGEDVIRNTDKNRYYKPIIFAMSKRSDPCSSCLLLCHYYWIMMVIRSFSLSFSLFVGWFHIQRHLVNTVVIINTVFRLPNRKLVHRIHSFGFGIFFSPSIFCASFNWLAVWLTHLKLFPSSNMNAL